MGLTIHIPGQAIPQGSKTVFWKSRTMAEANPKLKAWRATVTGHALAQLRFSRATEPLDGPLGVWLVFTLTRPASVPASRIWPATKPDLDKLVRAVLDGLTDATVWTNDSRVVSIRAQKRYAKPHGKPHVYCHIFNVELEAVRGAECGSD